MPPPNFSQQQPPPGRIAAYLQEILQLSPAEVRGVALQLSVTLSNSQAATNTYKVPGDQDLVITGIQGFLRFPTLASEPTTGILSYLNPDPSERWFMKSQNCLVSLLNTDRSLEMFEAGATPMSAITPPVGVPLSFPLDMPNIVPAGMNLRATFTLQDTTAAIVGNATIYGLLLSGALIPRRA